MSIYQRFPFENPILALQHLFPQSLFPVHDAPSGIDKHCFEEYNSNKCDTWRFNVMPLSLRIPPDKEKLINKAATKAGKTKSAFILEAVDEKLGLVKDRERHIRDLAGWLPAEEAKKLRESLRVFREIHEGDWD
jgi:hypothetical protein